MFTVLLAEKEHIDAIRQENKLFFEPFLESKELAFCNWNPTGQTLYESAPDLMDAVGRRKEWRVVIINSCTEGSLKARNPFDVVDSSDLFALEAPSRQPAQGEDIALWEKRWNDYFEVLSEKKEQVYRAALESPLQKITTWLCFRPEDYILSDVQDKQDAFDWALEQVGGEELKINTSFELKERNQYKRELRMRETLRREFVSDGYLNISYPTEIYCITPRTAENGFFDPDTYWNIRREAEYSSFAERNMYFDKMRFMVFDLLSRTHRNFRTDYIRFLASVLIFSSNPIPASAMQSRKLYRLEVESDDTPLCTLITSYDRKLANTAEEISNQMDKIRNEIPNELSDKAAEALFCTPIDVSVLLDESCEPERVLADKDYGLFFDSPENENHKWNRDYASSKKELAYIAKQQARSIKKSINQVHLSGEISNASISRLTSLQIDDIREFTDAAEDKLVDSIPRDLTDIAQYNEQLEEESDKVKKVISQRMRKKTVICLAALCLGLYLVSFLPFLFSNNGNINTVLTAVFMIIATLGVLSIVMVASLFVMRSSVTNAIRSYNNKARDVLADIQDSMRRFSAYLSASGTVRRGHAVQNYAEKNVDEYTRSIRIRKKHQEDIRKRRAYLEEEYRDYFADRSFCDETLSQPYEYDFSLRTEYNYPAPFIAGDSRQIEFISAGNLVTVPSSYVTRILVKMEGIYE